MEIETSTALFADAVKPSARQEIVPLEQALGRVLAEDIYAPINVPHFPKAAMDGYALRANDTFTASTAAPCELNIVAKIYAGESLNIAYAPKTCVRIMTGAPVPAGYDCVVKQEDVLLKDNVCLISKPLKQYENYCDVAEDVRQGSLLMRRGTLLQPVHLGVLASCGLQSVAVLCKLKAALLTTGTELVSLGQQLQAGKIYNSLGYLLGAALQKQGIDFTTALCEDEESKLAKALNSMSGTADIIITTGGVSVGEKDLLPKVMKQLGAKCVFAKVNIQPGGATQGWFLGEKPVLCLSGNPYAAFANFELYFWDLASKLLSCEALKVKQGNARLKQAVTKQISRRRLLRAYADEGWVEVLTEGHRASAISDLLKCNCFVDVKSDQNLAAGAMVKIRYFK